MKIKELTENVFSKQSPPPMWLIVRWFDKMQSQGYSADDLVQSLNQQYGLELSADDIEKYVVKNIQSK